MIARARQADDSPALTVSDDHIATFGCGCWASHPDGSPEAERCGWCGTWQPPRPSAPMLAPTLRTARLATRIALRAARAIAR